MHLSGTHFSICILSHLKNVINIIFLMFSVWWYKRLSIILSIFKSWQLNTYYINITITKCVEKEVCLARPSEWHCCNGMIRSRGLSMLDLFVVAALSVASVYYVWTPIIKEKNKERAEAQLNKTVSESNENGEQTNWNSPILDLNWTYLHRHSLCHTHRYI